jgi:hypothetical protein
LIEFASDYWRGEHSVAKQGRRPTALKHGAYSQTGLLPGEDAAAFKKLHDDLVVEFSPSGPVEKNIVADLARLYWRKQNMVTYRLAEQARNRKSAIYIAVDPPPSIPGWDFGVKGPTRSPEEIRAARAAADKQARDELAEVWELIEVGKVATVEYLLEELSIFDRLDSIIDRCLKRLLFVRGIKSYSQHSSEASPPRRISAAKA